jgi:hypothetical protein
MSAHRPTTSTASTVNLKPRFTDYQCALLLRPTEVEQRQDILNGKRWRWQDCLIAQNYSPMRERGARHRKYKGRQQGK